MDRDAPTITLLDYDRLEAAVNLVNELFPEEGITPAESLRSIFEPHLHPMDFAHGICDRICWIAAQSTGEHPTHRIAGVVGLYRMWKDSDALYLGWFGVQSVYRCKGVGERLLGHAIAEARRAGVSHLRLDTTDAPGFASANRLYERHGFAVAKRENIASECTWPTVWRELPLADDRRR